MNGEQTQDTAVGKGSVTITLPGGTTVHAESEGAQVDVGKAVWDSSYVSKLPDENFLHIEAGGKKKAGITHPVSLRHFPVKDAAGNVDLPHLRNALARIPQSNLPQAVKDSCTAKAKKMLEAATPKKTEKAAFECDGRIIKGTEPEGTTLHYVLNVALEPNPPEDGVTNDTQHDAYSKLDVWDAQRSFQKSKVLGLRHREVAKGATILHDWITPVEFEFGGQSVKEGSWLLGVEIDEDNEEGANLWKGIESGEINAFSIGGEGERIALEE